MAKGPPEEPVRKPAWTAAMRAAPPSQAETAEGRVGMFLVGREARAGAGWRGGGAADRRRRRAWSSIPEPQTGDKPSHRRFPPPPIFQGGPPERFPAQDLGAGRRELS
jgi:hypothetical protein